jgi:hypothetical protein
MADQPIPVSDATAMINEYISYMTSLGVNMNNQTQSTSFGGTDLTTWLNTVMAYADELRIFNGRYPAGHANAGRTTVILWPYYHNAPAVDNKGKTIEPLNEGVGRP